MTITPLMFVGHGSPMFAIDTGEAAQNLAGCEGNSSNCASLDY